MWLAYPTKHGSKIKKFKTWKNKKFPRWSKHHSAWPPHWVSCHNFCRFPFCTEPRSPFLCSWNWFLVFTWACDGCGKNWKVDILSCWANAITNAMGSPMGREGFQLVDFICCFKTRWCCQKQNAKPSVVFAGASKGMPCMWTTFAWEKVQRKEGNQPR